MRKKIIYCLETTGMAGGHRVVFEHIKLLAAQGWDVELFAMSRPQWVKLDVPVTVCVSYSVMQEMLEKEGDVIKVATWWKTQKPVFESCKKGGGVPVYFVQDIEKSYYAEDPVMQTLAMKSYEKTMKYITTSDWNMKQLEKLGIKATKINPAINHNIFKPDKVVSRQPAQILYCQRGHQLKNLDLTIEVIERIGNKYYDWVSWGIEPQPVSKLAKYVFGPSDAMLARLHSEATVFLSTSKHEGFNLTVLEAMACGAVVVTTNADGNMEYCVNKTNCLVVDSNGEAIAKAIEKVVKDKELRDFLQVEAIETAKRYNYGRLGEELNNFYKSLC